MTGDTGHLIYTAADMCKNSCPTRRFEQVPDVLLFWEEFAREFLSPRLLTCMHLDILLRHYGIPQTRQPRHPDSVPDHPVGPPEPTHAKIVAQPSFGPKATTMDKYGHSTWVGTR